ncbi:MAG: response regulator [Gammaproteobacteria bacterium]|nr:response regulator [Gammaproteobacteria bacterium]
MQTEISHSLRHHVYREIDASLRDARYALEAYLDENSEGTEFFDCIKLISEVNGAIEILDHESLILLTNALVKLSDELKLGRIDEPEAALALLLKGMLEIPNYLFLLEHDAVEYERFYVPLVNEIYRVLGQKIFLDDEPEVNANNSEESLVPLDNLVLGDKVRDYFKTKRPEYLHALLAFYKNPQISSAERQALYDVIEDLAVTTQNTSVGEYFKLAGLVLIHDLDSTPDSLRSIKLLFGRLDSLIKSIITHDELVDNAEFIHLANKLVGKAVLLKSDDSEVEKVQQKFPANVIVNPAVSDIRKYRDFVEGPNTESFESIAHIIRVDLIQLKESFETFLADKNLYHLDGTVQLLVNIVNVLELLGFVENSQSLSVLADELAESIKGQVIEQEFLDRFSVEIVDLERNVEYLAQIRSSKTDSFSEDVSVLELNSAQTEYIRQIKDAVNKLSVHLVEIKKSSDKMELKENIINELQVLKGVIGFYFGDKLDAIFQSFIKFVTELSGKNSDNVLFQNYADRLIDIEAICVSYIENYTDTEELINQLEQDIVTDSKPDEVLPDAVLAESDALESFVGELAENIKVVSSTPDSGLDSSKGIEDPFTDAEFDFLLSALETEIPSDSTIPLDATASSVSFIEDAIEPLNVINYLQPKWMDNISDQELLNEVRSSYQTLKTLAENNQQKEIAELCHHLVDMITAIEQQTISYSMALGDILAESEKELIKIISLADAGIQTEDLEPIKELAESIGALLKHVAPVEYAELTDSKVTESKIQLALDSELYEIYEKETQSHLNTIKIFSENNLGDLISDDVIRALHTMHGSSHMANVHDMAAITGELEDKFLDLQGNGFRQNSATSELLSEFVDTTILMLPLLLQDGAEYPDKSDFIERIKSITNKSDNEDRLADVTVHVDSNDELLEIFLEEAQEILSGLDVVLTKWQQELDNKEIIHELERALHTLKGGARMASLQILADISHAVESKLRSFLDEGDGDLAALSDMVSLSVEQLVNIVESILSKRDIIVSGNLLSLLELAEAYAVPSPSVDAEPEMAIHDVSFVDSFSELVLDNELDLDAELDTSIELNTDILLDSVIDLDVALDLDDENEELDIPLQLNEPELVEPFIDSALSESVSPDTKTHTESEDVDASESSQLEQIRVRADILDSLVKQASESNTVTSSFEKHLTEFKTNMDEMNSTVERLKAQLRQLEIETESQIVYRMDGSTGSISNDFDPLEFDRFTQLQTLSRGMVESLSDLENIESSIKKELRNSEKTLSSHSRVSQDLQDGLLRTRMTPFKTVLPRLTRVVSQTSRELSKPVELHTHGDDVEVDGTLLAKVVSPIEHILRNAVYHGIERTEIRAARKKPDLGNVSLNIEYEGANLVITISDDGGGLDTDAVRSKAVQLGVLPENAVISDEDAAQLILESGLSTANELSQISGRGVGMDVVNTEVRTVGGTLHIATKKNRGTTFTLHLPSKMSLLQALLVTVGHSHYAIPVVGIDGIETYDAEKLRACLQSDDALTEWADDTYHVVGLEQLLETGKDSYINPASKYTVIYTRFAEHRYAIYVDSYMGNKEIVTKQFGPQFDEVRGVQGATILSDGTLALILDLSTLVRPGIKAVLSKYSSSNTELDSRATVLVVDDSITVRRVSEKFLERNGYNVLTSKDGIDAISILEEHTPDILLLDIEMPRMNGYDLLQHIRRDERLKELPVIMITSRTGEKHRDKAFELGANDYFGKPYNETKLAARINELIQ